MAIWNVEITSRVTLSTTVEADNLNEAYAKAEQYWYGCDENEMEFNHTQIDVYENV